MEEEELTVLLVEDDEAVAEMYRLRLELDGYRVLRANNGEEGLRVAIEARPDLVYLDIRLPRMDGMEVLQALRQDAYGRTVPVILISNYSEPELVERGLALGALDYLVKADTSPSEFSRRIAGWIAIEGPDAPVALGERGPSQLAAS